MSDKIRVSIVGGTGYTGLYLLKILQKHSRVSLARITSRKEAGRSVADVCGSFAHMPDLLFSSFDAAVLAKESDVVFACVPHTEAMSIVQELRSQGDVRIIDLSADFRLRDPHDYKTYYKKDHICPDLITQAVYGLPELYRTEIQAASLVANPGCFPTSVVLGIGPLLKAQCVDPKDIVIDAKTGATGAGRVPSQKLHFPELNENIVPYKVVQHQHVGEMQQELSQLCGSEVIVDFVPHLIPVTQGIVSTHYLRLTKQMSPEDLIALYEDYYQDEFFLRVLPDIPQSLSVVNTNFCDIGIRLDPRTNRVIVVSAIDNMYKGASGQAVQNMNLMFGCDEKEALI